MPSRNVYIDHLASIPLFSRCSKRELNMIARLGTDLRFPAGAVLVREGTAGYEFFILVSGKAVVSRDGQDVAVLGPGDFFGELALLDGTSRRNATVVADTKVEAIVVSSQEFRALLREAPELTFKLLAAMGHRLQQLDTRST